MTNTHNDQDMIDTSPNIRSAVILGGVVTVMLFTLVLGWGGSAPIASASIAQGTVGVEGKTRIVQHLEGGIVRNILVQNGDKIAAGEVIVQLDDTKARATYDMLAKQRMVAIAELARLQSEQQKLDYVKFPIELTESTDAATQEIVKGQVSIFTSRRKNLINQIAVLRERISEHKAENIGLKGRIDADEQQRALTQTQVIDVRNLLSQGLARKPRLLELELKASEIESRLRHGHAQIERNRQRIEGALASIAEISSKQDAQVADDLRTAKSELMDMDERLRAAKDVLSRTEIIAPVDGVITDLRVHTTGGVIAPGEPVVKIVPEDERLIIEARVKPDDIDVVRKGLDAYVRFTALSQRTVAPSPGRVRAVSADHMVDEATGESYFLAIVELRADADMDELKLYPGMSAEVMIETGSRTVLAYLFEPLTNSFNRAFREN